MSSQHPTHPLPEARRVLEFWLSDGLQLGWPTEELKERWFKGGPALDQHIRDQFGPLVAQAMTGGLQDWALAPLNRLALVILLDQFSRNVFRGTAEAFAGDARSQRLVLDALQQDWDRQLPWVGRVFLYMPLMHSERMDLQGECVRRFEHLLAQAPQVLHERLENNLTFARQHQDIIDRFGRFPYRNAVLGRNNNAAEEEFLKSGPRFGQ